MQFTARRIVSLTVLATGISMLAVSYLRRTARANQAADEAPIGYTMIQHQSLTITGTTPALRAVIVRHQKSGGAWKQVTTYYKTDGSVQKVDTGFGEPHRGTFRETKSGVEFMSPFESRRASSAQYYSDPRFVREETLLGYKVFVLRETKKDGYQESYFSPRLHPVPIKQVFAGPIGREVIEPVRIVPGEPDSGIFTTSLNSAAQCDFEFYRRKIGQVEKSGNASLASEMRRQLAIAEAREKQS